jgi:hypothetical protein
MKKRRYLIIGGVLMSLLGLARGVGGLVLLTRGAAADPNIQATDTAVLLAGVTLALLGSALIAAGVGVFRMLRSFWLLGIICTVAFVVDGAINGLVLYGHPGDRGTIANVIVAALILTCLLLGKSTLRDGSVRL